MKFIIPCLSRHNLVRIVFALNSCVEAEVEPLASLPLHVTAKK